jgi:cytochrome P450/NADPH-cytochrome P450 reductase
MKDLFRKGASLYLCGAGVVGVGVEQAMANIRVEGSNDSIEGAIEWVKAVKGDRFWADDVFI